MAGQRFSPGIVSLSAREPEELSDGVRDLAWSSEYVALECGFRTVVAAVQTAQAQMIRVAFRASSIAYGHGPTDSYVFAARLGRGGSARLGGEELSHRNVGVVRPGQGYEFHVAARAELVLVSIPKERVESAVPGRRGDFLADALGRSTFQLRDTHPGRTLGSVWATRLLALRGSPQRLDDREAEHEIEEPLLEEVLGNLALEGAPVLVRREAARRAAAFLQANWHHPLRLADICEASGAPERTLRQGFREVYGRAPMSYLRSLRFRAARAMLRRADTEQRISDIALRCGFSHLGSFSVEYRRAFGETPSQTRSG